MTDQRDVQQLIQGLTPSGVNNGNPNTAYNNSPTTAGGSPIPVMDAFGNWSRPQISPAASISFNRAASSLPASTPLNLPRLPSGILGSTPIQGGVVPPADPLNPWTPPTQVGGGGGTPSTGTSGGGGASGPPIMDQLSQGGISGVPSTGFQQPGTSGTGGGVSLPTNALFPGMGSSGMLGNTALGQLLGYDAGTNNMDWQQLVDLASEGVMGFGGNDLYQPNINKWNSAEVLKGTLDSIFGGGTGALAQKIGLSNFFQTLEDKGVAPGLIDSIQDFFLKSQIQSGMEGERAMLNEFTSRERQNQMRDTGLGASNSVAGWMPSISFDIPTGTATVGDILSGPGTGPLTQAQLEAGYAQGAGTNAPVTGGSGGPRSTVQYGSEAERQASIAATQDALRAAAARSPNTRQTGGDIYGHLYEQ